LIFLGIYACSANIVFIDIINLRIHFDRGYYVLNLNPTSQYEKWGLSLEGKMRKKQYILLVALALIGGLVGGTLSNQVFLNKVVFAEKKIPKVVEAEEFRLIDKNGKIIAHLGMNVRSSPELRILTPAYGNRKRTGVIISASKYSSNIWLFGEKTKISMAVNSHPGINSPGIQNAEIKIGFSGWSGLADAIKSGKQLERNSSSIRLNIGESEGIISGPSVILTSKSGKTHAVLGRVELEVTSTGETRERLESSLVFFDRDGKSIWSAP